MAAQKKYVVMFDSVLKCYRRALTSDQDLIKGMTSSGRHIIVAQAANLRETAKVINAHKNGK